MTKLNFHLPISNFYTQGPLVFRQHTASVDIELTPGDHLFTSASIEIGNYFHYKVFALLSIPYHYDPETQYVTIAGPDDTGNRQLSIHTSLEQHPGITDTHRLHNMGFARADHNLWSDFINKSTDAKQINKIVIRQAIDTLVQQLLHQGVQGVIQTGSAPVVTPYNYKDYKDMFLPAKDDVLMPSLEDILAVQSVVDSTYWGTITWNLNYSFANIIGSTDDPHPSGYSSWIKLWADKCNGGHNTTLCSSYNYSDGKSGFSCGSDFVGGHVIPGATAKKVATGGVAYIFPICKGHNNNDNIYMSMRYNPTGVVLHNYHQ